MKLTDEMLEGCSLGIYIDHLNGQVITLSNFQKKLQEHHIDLDILHGCIEDNIYFDHNENEQIDWDGVGRDYNLE